MSKKQENRNSGINSEKDSANGKDDTYLEERILIPDSGESEGIFSWRKLWLFTGPGWLST